MTTANGTSTPGSALAIEDRLEIIDAVGGSMLHLDLKDWRRVLDYLMPQVTTDYTSVFGGDPVTCTRESLVEGWSSRLPGFDATQHTVTQTSVSGSSTRATTVSNLRAAHWVDGRIWAFGGTYHHELVKTSDGWRISSIRIKMAYEEGDRSVRLEALDRMTRRAGIPLDELTVLGRSPSQRGT